jgi:hypothetical protein
MLLSERRVRTLPDSHAEPEISFVLAVREDHAPDAEPRRFVDGCS